MGSHETALPERLVSHLLAEDPDLRDIVEEFVAGLSERISELRRAYEQLDWTLLATLAHRLRGASGSYGYPDIGQLATEMETGFKRQDATLFPEWMQRMTRLAEAARAGLGE